jgi:signal transduction histidine kinase
MIACATQRNKVPPWRRSLASGALATTAVLPLVLRTTAFVVLSACASPAECSSRLALATPRVTLINTVFVLAGVAALSAAIRWCLYRYATSMHIRLDERMQERNRIARDMHDTLLQTIQFSKMVADDAQEQTADPERMRIALQKLSAWLERASKEGRAVLDSLRIATIHADDLATALERALIECRLKAEIQTTMSVTGSPVDLHPMVHDELFRIGYEAIHNACIHAMAKNIDVELGYRRGLTLKVNDDGVGIDPVVLAGGKRGHYGIVGMRERAARIGGRLSITSDATGTRLVLSVPFRGTEA